MIEDGVPEIGDVVVHYIDKSNQITCYGTIIEMKKDNCLVIWSSESLPVGWHKMSHLEVVSDIRNKVIKK
jgi:hypothetical protein